MYPNVHYSTIYNSQDMEATQMSTDEWIKKQRYIYTMECYSAIKRNTFETVLMRWMNLEPIIQSEISQKEKIKYCILMFVCGIQKYGTDESCSQKRNEWRHRRREQTYGLGQGKRGRGRNKRREQHGYIYTNVCKQIANGSLLYDSRNSSQGSVITQRQEVGGRIKKEVTYVHLWLIHVDVGQKSNQYCFKFQPISTKFHLIKNRFFF